MLSEELARATAQLGEASPENKLLREKIDALVRRLFGAQGEKLYPAQLLLMLQSLEAEAPRRSTPASPPRSDRGPRWPADLQVIDPECMARERLFPMAADWLRPIYEQIRTGVLGGALE